jgi:hypothetical protein
LNQHFELLLRVEQGFGERCFMSGLKELARTPSQAIELPSPSPDLFLPGYADSDCLYKWMISEPNALTLLGSANRRCHCQRFI